MAFIALQTEITELLFWSRYRLPARPEQVLLSNTQQVLNSLLPAWRQASHPDVEEKGYKEVPLAIHFLKNPGTVFSPESTQKHRTQVAICNSQSRIWQERHVNRGDPSQSYFLGHGTCFWYRPKRLALFYSQNIQPGSTLILLSWAKLLFIYHFDCWAVHLVSCSLLYRCHLSRFWLQGLRTLNLPFPQKLNQFHGMDCGGARGSGRWFYLPGSTFSRPCSSPSCCMQSTGLSKKEHRE